MTFNDKPRPSGQGRPTTWASRDRFINTALLGTTGAWGGAFAFGWVGGSITHCSRQPRHPSFLRAE